MEMHQIIIFFVVAGLASSAIILFAMSKSRIKQKQLEEYALSQEWDYEYKGAQGHVGNLTVISSPLEQWRLSMYFNSSSTGEAGTSIKQWSEFSCPDGKLEEGLAILGPALPQKTIQVLNQGSLGPLGFIIKKLMFEFVNGMGIDIDDCKLVEQEQSDERGAVFATAGNEQAVDTFKSLRELSQAKSGKNEMQQPVVYRDTDGTKVRLRHKLKSVEELNAFINLCVAIQKRAQQLDKPI
ncbi:hypothetical protein PN836_009390 [Ningiella sp. W23]|uniref:hypothetical protein n=1 Tax=Ningiella sp. W23 TaxID=3023715 RepID=UPI003756B58E